MKLIKKQIRVAVKCKATITLSKNGLITISKKAAEAIGLKEGNGIEIFQDADALSDWYIRPGEGLKLRLYSQKRFVTNCSSIVSDFFECFPELANVKSARFILSTEPIAGGYFAIITRKAI